VLDADGDGDVDIMIVGGIQTSTFLLVNNGSGFFSDGSAARLFPNRNGDFVAVSVADVDVDGDVDVFVAMSSGANKLYINSGRGFFNETSADRGVSSMAVGVVPRGTAVGDVDGDGDVDVYVCGNGSMRLFRNNGTGGFADVLLAADAVAPGVTVVGAAFGDVDLDGDVDLFAAFASPSTSMLLLNNGSGGFGSSGLSMSVSGAASLVDTDSDGDSDLDVPSVGYKNPNPGQLSSPRTLVVTQETVTR
jgi:hypothetical protein